MDVDGGFVVLREDVYGGCGCRRKKGVEGVYIDLDASKGGFSEDLSSCDLV